MKVHIGTIGVTREEATQELALDAVSVVTTAKGTRFFDICVGVDEPPDGACDSFE